MVLLESVPDWWLAGTSCITDQQACMAVLVATAGTPKDACTASLLAVYTKRSPALLRNSGRCMECHVVLSCILVATLFLGFRSGLSVWLIVAQLGASIVLVLTTHCPHLPCCSSSSII